MSQPLDNLSLRALRGFHAIVVSGSATEAARRLGLTQPGVSRLLSQLEQQVGFELFIRDHGKLIPTQEGKLLFEEVDVSLLSMERVYTLVRDIAGFRVGQLKVVAPPSFSEGVLPEIVKGFLNRFPRVRLSIDARSFETSKELIATRVADCGFLRLPLDRPDLRTEKIVTSRTACVMAADHPLARIPTLTPAMLRGEPLILLGQGRLSRIEINGVFARDGVNPHVRLETHTIASACAFAERGLGIALVNEMLAAPYLRPGLVLTGFSPVVENEYAFVTSALSKPTQLTEQFLQQTRAHFGVA